MHNTELVNILDSADDVLEESASFLFFQFSLLDNVIKELSLLHILHNQKQVLWCLDNLNEEFCTS